jgi:hypothetical protein
MEQKTQEGRVAFPDDPKLLGLGINITATMFKRFKADLKSDLNPVSTLIDTGKGKKNDAGIVHLFAGLNTDHQVYLKKMFERITFKELN